MRYPATDIEHALEDQLKEANKLLRSARLMLYAWRGARKNFGLKDNHIELNSFIAEIETYLKRTEPSQFWSDK